MDWPISLANWATERLPSSGLIVFILHPLADIAVAVGTACLVDLLAGVRFGGQRHRRGEKPGDRTEQSEREGLSHGLALIQVLGARS